MAGLFLWYTTHMHLPRAESKTVEFMTAFNQDTIVSLVAFADSDGGSVDVGTDKGGNREVLEGTK